MSDQKLHAFWWLWIPVVFMVVQVFIEMTLPYRAREIMHSENGPHETIQFFVIAAACPLSFFGVTRAVNAGKTGLAAWLGLAGLCCFYVAGEEISWGQHIFEWTTPEFWTNINDQKETNLHNTSSWLDQKPRLVLEIGIVTGGLIFPVLQKLKPGLLPAKFNIIYPPACLWFVASMVIWMKVIQAIAGSFNILIFARGSEVQELAMFYFVLLYVIVLIKRIRDIK